MANDERSALLRPPVPSSDGAASAGSSAASLPLHTAGKILGITVRRARRRSALLLSAMKNAVGPSPKHEPMSSWGCFLFLSNLILGPGILGLPAAYRTSGVFWATALTCAFAAASVLACIFLAHATRIFRQEARARRERRRRGGGLPRGRNAN